MPNPLMMPFLMAAVVLSAPTSVAAPSAEPGETALLSSASTVGPGYRSECWVSDTELLVTRKDDPHVYCFNALTRSVEPLTRLNRQLDRLRLRPGDLQPSPDGRWLMWRDNDRKGYFAVITSLDGSKVYKTRTGDRPAACMAAPNNIFWGYSPDTWWEEVPHYGSSEGDPIDSTLLLRKVDSGRVVRRCAVPKSLGENDVPTRDLKPTPLGFSCIEEMELGVRLVVLTADSLMKVISDEKRLGRQESKWAHGAVSLDGRRICWLSEEGEGKAKAMRLYAAEVPQGEARVVGFIPFDFSKVSGDPGMTPAFLSETSPRLTWVSFDYHGTLYVYNVTGWTAASEPRPAPPERQR